MADQVTATGFAVRSQAFDDGGEIPQRHARGVGGESVSFPLSWNGVPAGTRSFALMVLDTHPVAHGFVHWLVSGIPASAEMLPEGASGHRMPPGAVEGPNSAGRNGYTGPYPPPGSGAHEYVTMLYALDVDSLPMPARPDPGYLARTAEGHVLARATVAGTYER